MLGSPGADVLVWSDLHLGHANIIDYQSRSFFDADDMNAELWRRWKRMLNPESVLVLGRNVATGEALGEATSDRIRRSPAQHKHLVIRNHDLTGLGELRAQGFDDVWSVMVSAGTPPLAVGHYPPGATTLKRIAHLEQRGAEPRRGRRPHRLQ